MSDWIRPLLQHLEPLLQPQPYAENARILTESLGLLPPGDAGDTGDMGRARQRLAVAVQLARSSGASPGESVAGSVERALFQVLNDVTWLIETALVEQGLGRADEAACGALLALMDGPAWTHGADGRRLQRLGAELAEVALWRRGALRFMATAVAVREQRVRPQTLELCVRMGTCDLEAVLVQRDGTPDALVRPGEELVYGQGGRDVEEMVRDKIYSDTHLLSLAYAAELYYYGWKYARPIDPAAKAGFRNKAVGLFEKYVRIVNGPMKGAGWSTDKADEILGELRKQPV